MRDVFEISDAPAREFERTLSVITYQDHQQTSAIRNDNALTAEFAKDLPTISAITREKSTDWADSTPRERIAGKIWRQRQKKPRVWARGSGCPEVALGAADNKGGGEAVSVFLKKAYAAFFLPACFTTVAVAAVTLASAMSVACLTTLVKLS